jgi:glycolate oxidase iron-sulfur subunit
MQTRFSPAQLTDPLLREADAILRKCVHCGFCTATCPTFVLLGDELDSPRGRIYLIKEMLEQGGPPPVSVVKHADRCVTCLSCMTTCPSGVDYMHLIDVARQRIEDSGAARPVAEHWLRWLLSRILSDRRLFRWAIGAAALVRPFSFLVPDRLRPLVAMAPNHLPPPSASFQPQTFPATGTPKGRVALLTGCVQPVLDTAIHDSTIRLLNRHGVTVVVAAGAECCGGLAYHLGKADFAKRKARASIEAWWGETRDGGGLGLDAIVITTSGCGISVKDYGHMFRAGDPVLARKAEAVAALAVDITEFVERLGPVTPKVDTGQRVAYHSACSLQHGQRIRTVPQALLRQAGFDVKEVPEGHLCCGSAGTYNMLQPELSDQLKQRKIGNIETLSPDIIATGNLGCILQIGGGTRIPIVHTVQLLDWATGGPRPEGLDRL